MQPFLNKDLKFKTKTMDIDHFPLKIPLYKKISFQLEKKNKLMKYNYLILMHQLLIKVKVPEVLIKVENRNQ